MFSVNPILGCVSVILLNYSESYYRVVNWTIKGGETYISEQFLGQVDGL